MVKNSSKTYGQLINDARSMTDQMEVADLLPQLMEQFVKIIEDAYNGNKQKGIKGKYYVHIIVKKDIYANNALHVYPMSRRTRPSPYQTHDHFLWSIEDDGKVKFEWCIPSHEVLTHILKNPDKFDVNYVRMLKSFTQDKIEKLSDYVVKDKPI